MVDTTMIAPWVRRFLLEHVVGERNLSPNTQKSYRDMLLQLTAVRRWRGSPADREADGAGGFRRPHSPVSEGGSRASVAAPCVLAISA
jgi:hypothetical protein